MKRMKKTIILLLAAALPLAGCNLASAPETPETVPTAATTTTTSESVETASEEPAAGAVITADEQADNAYAEGPYGRISVSLPEGWLYQPYSVDSEKSNSGSYGMWIQPEDEKTGYIDLCYMQQFGVCGTGLEEETTTLAGDEAWIGTYDNHEMWDFINFRGINEGIVAQNVMGVVWTEENREKALLILDSLKFEPEKAQGAVSYFKSDSELPEIGLIADAYKITGSGATVRFRVWDPELASGELEYGDDYSLERLEGDEWIQVPDILKGEWAVNDIAYIISKEPESAGSEWEVNWEWLYGKLTPGDYRIGKSVMDFRGTGDYDTYKIYVYFRYAGDAAAAEHGPE